MIANPILLQKKYARIVELFAKTAEISIEAALDFFYQSKVYQLVKDGVSDMHCMSDDYLVEDLMREYSDMSSEKVEVTLPMITAALSDKICSVYHLSENAAIEKLYNTKFYEYLEQEDAKIRQYNVEKLFDLYQMEIETGHLELPKYWRDHNE